MGYICDTDTHTEPYLVHRWGHLSGLPFVFRYDLSETMSLSCAFSLSLCREEQYCSTVVVAGETV